MRKQPTATSYKTRENVRKKKREREIGAALRVYLWWEGEELCEHKR